MNDDLIFRKTPAGEEAIRERTRLVQRNLRMVLILVDGAANVGALKQSAGDPTIAESALAELESMGLIARVGPGSFPTESTEPEAMIDDQAAIPMGVGDVGPETQWPSSISPEQSAYGPDSILPEETSGAAAPMQESPATVEPAKPSVLKGMFGGERQEANLDQAVFDFGDGDISSGALGAATVIGNEERRSWRPKIRIKGLVLGGIAVFLAMLVWQLFIRSYDAYRPEFERALSIIADDVVMIGKVRVSYLPVPAILLEDVKVGSPAHTSIASIHLVSEPWSFLGDRHRFRRVTLDGMRARDVDLPKLSKWISPGRMTNVTVDHLEIVDLTLELGREAVTGLAGDIALGTQGGIEKVAFHSTDGSLQVEAKPAAEGWMVALVANGWQSPTKPAALFSKLDLQGRLVPGRFTMSQFTARVCEGLISGNGTIDWQRQPAMALSLDVQHVGASCLLTELGAAPLVDGPINASLVVSSMAPSFGELAKTWRLEGKFGVARGTLKHLDLAEALRKRTNVAVVRGGNTPFEELAGTVLVNDQVVHVGSTRLASGLMRASGQATVSRRQGTIAGDINAELRSSTGVVRAPFAISGGASEPELKTGR